MTATKDRVAKLTKVKLALAKKYDQRSKNLKSKTAQAKARNRAASYRHEATVLSYL